MTFLLVFCKHDRQHFDHLQKGSIRFKEVEQKKFKFD